MKLQPDQSASLTVTSYSATWIAVNGVRYPHNLLINSRGLILPWPCEQFKDIQASHLDLIEPVDAEIILFGCGIKQLFVPPKLFGEFICRNMGLETMNTPAACRTFNFLASERRRVAAVLFLEHVQN